MRWRRGLIGLVGDMIATSEEHAEEQRRRENMMLATAALTTGYGQGYGDNMNVGPQSMNLADAVQESLRYALELTERLESPGEGAIRPDDQLRKDYLTFLGYLHNPKQADPVPQVGMVQSVLRMNVNPQMYFQHREKYSLDPEFPKQVPLSLQYYVQDEMGGGSGPVNSGFCMSRFLVNTFREFGHAYISFGGISPQEMRRLIDYIVMLNVYLNEHNLYRSLDPYRKGETGNPYYGLPVNPEDLGALSAQPQGIEMPGAGGINMPGAGGINMPGAGGIDMPGAGGIEMPGAGGIDMPSSKGIDMPHSGGIDMPSSKSIDMPGSDENVRPSGSDEGSGNREGFAYEGRGGMSLADRDDLTYGGRGLGDRDDPFDGHGSMSLADRDDPFDGRGGMSLADRDDPFDGRGGMSLADRDDPFDGRGGMSLGERDY